MAFNQSLKEYFSALARYKDIDGRKCLYKSAPIIGEQENEQWELDVLLVTQLYGFAIGKYSCSHIVLKKDHHFYAVEPSLITDTQNELAKQHYEHLKLAPLSTLEETCLRVNAIETLCFAGQEFLATPVNFTSYLIPLGHNVYVLDAQRLSYKSLITPTRSMFTQTTGLEQIHAIEHTASLESNNELQSPSL
ncbi:hypothetical protein [Vibrio harveyi]|uniref:hypothetical protein n=1 Tax=Vibrio harveyi TaxID=669 RepID=UPI0024813A35|nr:hypothetical protein [Vibrio harveyi]